MSKTPEKVAQHAISLWSPTTPTLAEQIVSALRSAGWLRTDAEREHEHTTNLRAEFEAQKREIERLRTTQRTPAESAVIEAAKAWRRVWESAVCMTGSPGQILIAAVDALAPERATKVKPEKYFVIGRTIIERNGPSGGDDEYATYRRAAIASSECDRLNAAEGSKR